MLINIILCKMDKETEESFELSFTFTELRSWSDFIDLQHKYYLVLENFTK